jgi:hypothetical protein
MANYLREIKGVLLRRGSVTSERKRLEKMVLTGGSHLSARNEKEKKRKKGREGEAG